MIRSMGMFLVASPSSQTSERLGKMLGLVSLPKSRQTYRVPSHNSNTVLSIVKIGPPKGTRTTHRS